MNNNQEERYIGWGPKGSQVKGCCLCGVGVHHPPSRWICSSTQKVSDPCTFRIFMEISSCRHNWLLSPFLACPLSLENGEWGWKLQASNHSLVFWWPTLPSRSPARVTSSRKFQKSQEPFHYECEGRRVLSHAGKG